MAAAEVGIAGSDGPLTRCWTQESLCPQKWTAQLLILSMSYKSASETTNSTDMGSQVERQWASRVKNST